MRERRQAYLERKRERERERERFGETNKRAPSL